MTAIRNYGFRKALIVTDAGLAKAGVAALKREAGGLAPVEKLAFLAGGQR